MVRAPKKTARQSRITEMSPQTPRDAWSSARRASSTLRKAPGDLRHDPTYAALWKRVPSWVTTLSPHFGMGLRVVTSSSVSHHAGEHRQDAWCGGRVRHGRY